MKTLSKKIKTAGLGLLVSTLFFAPYAMASAGAGWNAPMIETAAVDNTAAISTAAGKVAEISTADANAYYDHGNGNYETGDRASAVNDFSSAIALNPGFAEAYLGRGVAYLALGNNIHAIVDLSRAIALKPGFAKAYYERGRAYLASGNKFQAARDFRKSEELKALVSRD